jgi:hypothetical protein
MTKGSLKPGQRIALEIIAGLSFGRIEQLSIRNGLPNFDRAPRIVEEIRLGSEPEHRPDNGEADMKKEFQALFNHLERLGDGVVDIEVRHAVPFPLIIERGHGGLGPVTTPQRRAMSNEGCLAPVQGCL